MIKCIQLYVITVCILLINIACKKYRDNSYAGYIRNNIHNAHRTRKKIYRRYAQKKKEKETYEEYFKELDKIFNECDYDAEQVEEEEKKKEEELNLITEKDLLEINFCNYEKDPRSLANLVKEKSEEEIEKENNENNEKNIEHIENIENIENNENIKNNTLEYSYDYDRILKKKKFLKEKIEYKDKFILNENHNKLVNNIDTSFMNDFLNNYNNDFNKPFYKARRDQYFAREDLVKHEINNNNQSEYKEERNNSENNNNNNNHILYDEERKSDLHYHKVSKDDQNNEDMLKENLESVLFLKRIRNNFDIKRNIYINETINDIKEKYNNNEDKTNRWHNIKNEDSHKERDEENRFHEYVEEKIKNANTDENVEKLILKKYIKMFSIDDEVLNINEKIKKCENVHSILEIFKDNKRINIINIMYSFIYIDRFKCLNITEYLYEKRFAYITYALEEIMKYYLYVLNKKGLKGLYQKKKINNLNNINKEDTEKIKINKDYKNNNDNSDKDNNSYDPLFEHRTLQLNDKNLIFLIKYMNKLKLFYINLNLYNMFFLILSKSFALCSANSFVILLSYINEYNYYNNNIHKKINISILNELFHIFKRDGMKSSGLNLAHFKILLPLLIKYKYVNNNVFKLLYLHFEKDIKDMIHTLTSNVKKKERKEICNVLFYDVKTKEQEKNKEKYLSYLKYEEMKEKKENMEILSQLLNYLMMCKFNEKDSMVLKLINIFIDYMHLLNVDQLLNIFFNYHIFQNNNEIILYRCKQELLNRKSLLKDYHINKILSYIIYNYRKAEIYRNYYRNWFSYKNYTIFRDDVICDEIQRNQDLTQHEQEMYNIKNVSEDDKKKITTIDKIPRDNETEIFNNNKKKNCNSPCYSFYDNYSEGRDMKKLPSHISLKKVLHKKKEIKELKKDYYINTKIFKDVEFLYDLTHDIHIYVPFKNVHLLKFVYNIYLLSLLFYKNMDVIRIASEIAYDLTDTNIFSFIDQYSYYLYDDIYIIIKTFKYISFFSIDLIDIWKKFFFLLNHFVNNLNLENIYDIFFFVHISKITNLKNENYDVLNLLTSRMKTIVQLLFTHNVQNFNTYPHTYILNILNMINDQNNEHVIDFVHFFFYSIYKRIQYLYSNGDNILGRSSYDESKMKMENTKMEDNIESDNNNTFGDNKIVGDDQFFQDNKPLEDNKSFGDNIKPFSNNVKADKYFSYMSDTKNKKSNEIYKNVNNYIYNFKDIRLFIKIFLRYYKKEQETFNLKIVDFILYNSEVFFFNMWTNRRYYQRHYFFGKEIHEFLHLLKELIQNKLYNSNIMYRCVNILKYIIKMQSTFNIEDIPNVHCNLYSNFFLHFDKINDINVWKYIRKVF